MSAVPLESETSTTFDDAAYVAHDLQRLLEDVSLSDGVLACGEHEHARFALHSQILRARSPFFSVALRPPWRRSELSLPNVSPEVARDVLEFLVTGCVRLDNVDVRHLLYLSLAAHELCADELLSVVVNHAQVNMTVSFFLDIISSDLSVLPDPVVKMLSAFCLKNIADVFSNISGRASNVDNVRTVLLLFYYAHGDTEFSDDDLLLLVKSIVAWSRREKGVTSIKEVMSTCVEDERMAIVHMFSALSVSHFARHVEGLGILSSDETLSKYREDAQASSRTFYREGTSQYVVCESAHPHPRGASILSTLRKVSPRECRSSLLLQFDRRSELGGGSELRFYRQDPATGAHAFRVLYGKLPDSMTLDCDCFWYAFCSPSEELDEGGLVVGLQSAWGWRFTVRSVGSTVAKPP